MELETLEIIKITMTSMKISSIGEKLKQMIIYGKHIPKVVMNRRYNSGRIHRQRR